MKIHTKIGKNMYDDPHSCRLTRQKKMKTLSNETVVKLYVTILT